MELQRWWDGADLEFPLFTKADRARKITVWNCLPHQGCQVHLEQGKRYCRCSYPRDPERLNVFWSGENVIPNTALFDACFAQEHMPNNHRIPFWAVTAGMGSQQWFGSSIDWEQSPALLNSLRNPLKSLTVEQALELSQGRDIDIAFVSRSYCEHRSNLVQRLAKRFRVTCAGSVLNNAPRVGGSYLDAAHFYRRCRFVVACENSFSDGYCTEKLFLPILAGAIPLYWGDPKLELDWDPSTIISVGHEIPYELIQNMLDSPQLQQQWLIKAPLRTSPNFYIDRFAKVLAQLPEPNPVRMAILVLATSRGRKWTELANSDLYTKLLPSLQRTAEPGFAYTVFVGVDQDDPLFSAKIGQQETLVSSKQWLIRLRWIGLQEQKGHVTEMWNRLFELAYSAGFEYFFQCSDDIVISGEFSSAAVSKLCESNGFGVAGPIDSAWREKQLLTQSIVSRKHMLLFGYYFPKEIVNWFCDDWICEVYSPNLKYMLPSVLFNQGGAERYIIVDCKDTYQELVKRDRVKLEVGMPILLRYQTSGSAQTCGFPTAKS